MKRTEWITITATGNIEELRPDSYAVGMFDFASYQSWPLQLPKEDILAVYSDGLTDAEGPHGEMFWREEALGNH